MALIRIRDKIPKVWDLPRFPEYLSDIDNICEAVEIDNNKDIERGISGCVNFSPDNEMKIDTIPVNVTLEEAMAEFQACFAEKGSGAGGEQATVGANVRGEKVDQMGLGRVWPNNG